MLVLVLGIFFFYQAAVAEESTTKKHMFYLHGAIIEQGDPKPVHPKYGLYDYPVVVAALRSHGFHVVSEQRASNTDYVNYAEKIAGQIKGLIEQGIEPQTITVVGFSKGAFITAIASSLLKNDDLNFAILASCNEWYEKGELLQALRLRGHILSIYEQSDDLAGSCEKVAKRTPAPSSFIEHAINTGKAHGAFFLPRSEWMDPLVT